MKKRNRSSPEVTYGLLLAASLALWPAEAKADVEVHREAEVERPILYDAWRNLVAWLAAISPERAAAERLGPAQGEEVLPSGIAARNSSAAPGEQITRPVEASAEGGAVDPHGGG